MLFWLTVPSGFVGAIRPPKNLVSVSFVGAPPGPGASGVAPWLFCCCARSRKMIRPPPPGASGSDPASVMTMKFGETAMIGSSGASPGKNLNPAGFDFGPALAAWFLRTTLPRSPRRNTPRVTAGSSSSSPKNSSSESGFAIGTTKLGCASGHPECSTALSSGAHGRVPGAPSARVGRSSPGMVIATATTSAPDSAASQRPRDLDPSLIRHSDCAEGSLRP
jgi:hypothetical protein